MVVVLRSGSETAQYADAISNEYVMLPKPLPPKVTVQGDNQHHHYSDYLSFITWQNINR